MTPPVRLAAFALLAGPALAQGQVWVVDDDPGVGVDFTNLFSAVNAAASGDVVLVRSGTYAPFHLVGKGLTIAADSDASVRIGTYQAGVESVVADVPEGERAVLRGLEFEPAFDFEPLAWTTGLEVRTCSGAVWIEDCVVDGGWPGGLHVVDCPAVVVDSTVALGSAGLFNGLGAYSPGAGLRAERSQVRATSSSFLGGDGINGSFGFPPIGPQAGAVGAQLLSAQLTMANGSLQGGQGGDGFGTPDGCAAEADGGASHQLADAIPLGFPASAWLADVALVGGLPGAPLSGCDRVADVGGVGGGATIDDRAPLLLTSSPVREGGLLAATAIAGPGTAPLGLLGVSTGATLVPDLALFGAIVVDAPLVVVPLGVFTQSGKTVTVTVPELGPGVESGQLFLQVVGCEAGGCLAGEASAVLMLDAAF